MIRNEPKFESENPNHQNKRVVGTAYIGAWAGVNDNGQARVQGATVSVNKPLQAPNWKHVSRIMGKKYTIIEEEDMDAKLDNGQMVSYSKLIDGKQTDIDGQNHVYQPQNDALEGLDNMLPQNGLDRVAVLKNLVDSNKDTVDLDREICNTRHENAGNKITTALCIGFGALVGLLIVVLKVFV